MDKYLQTFASFLMILSWYTLLLTPIKNTLHMFQQNRYELRRYFPWLIGEVKYQLKHSRLWLIIAGLFIVMALISHFSQLLAPAMSIGVNLALALYFHYQDRATVKIKPLVFTNRVKRQTVVMFILVTIEMMLIWPLSWNLRIIATPAIFLSPWIILFLVALITAPFEVMVKRSFIQQAKNILKNQPNLIKIGITGSYGKTSTKNILNEVLSESFYTLATPASFNTPMGLTITIREHLKSVHQVFIAEMGADKVGEIEYLSKFIQPKIGLITSIGPQHLNTFKNIENIIKEKMRLAENLPSDGLAVLNMDNEYIRNYALKNKCQILSYGIDHEADVKASDIEVSPNGSSFNVNYNNQMIPFKTRLLGKHNIANILSAICVGIYLGIPFDQLQSSVSKVNYIEHRLQLKTINGFQYIDNAFNSNPEGSKMSLDVLALMPGHRNIITPGMIDLGRKQDEYNKAFGAYMKGKVDTVLLIGQTQTLAIYEGLKESGFDMNHVKVFDKVKQAFDYIERNATRTDITLLENDLPDAFNR